MAKMLDQPFHFLGSGLLAYEQRVARLDDHQILDADSRHKLPGNVKEAGFGVEYRLRSFVVAPKPHYAAQNH